METTHEQARRLSSGTIATIAGVRSYYEITKIQNAFVAFIEECVQDETLTGSEPWQEAWQFFLWRKSIRQAMIEGAMSLEFNPIPSSIAVQGSDVWVFIEPNDWPNIAQAVMLGAEPRSEPWPNGWVFPHWREAEILTEFPGFFVYPTEGS
jgi:hypothetical protein